MCKTSTKPARVRKLLETAVVKERCSESSIKAVLRLLEEQEEKRRKKKLEQEENKDEAHAHHINRCCRENCSLHKHPINYDFNSMQTLQTLVAQAEIQWAELQDDPATNACRQLLEQMDEEDSGHKINCPMFT